MFCLGLVLNQEELSELKHKPATVLLGVLLQCTLMPFLAWSAVQLLRLDGELAQGVILVGCVPGAMASNVLTLTARGNVSYSIGLTTVATLLSPITVPLALSVIGGIKTSEDAFNPISISLKLLMTIVLPVVAGYFTKSLLSSLHQGAKIVAPWIASIALLWIIASVVATNRDRLSQIAPMMLLALLVINVCGYLGGYYASTLWRLPTSMRRALSLEVGMQNAGLGTALAGTLFGIGTLAQVPTAAYTFGCMLTGTILASYWQRISDRPAQ